MFKRLFKKRTKQKQNVNVIQPTIQPKGAESGSKTDIPTKSILILGAGGSGKSTLLKQFEFELDPDKFKSESPPACFNPINEVHKNITLDIYDLCKHYYMLRHRDESENSLQFESSDIEEVAIRIATTHDPIHNNKLTEQFSEDIHALWSTETMKKVYAILCLSCQFHLLNVPLAFPIY